MSGWIKGKRKAGIQLKYIPEKRDTFEMYPGKVMYIANYTITAEGWLNGTLVGPGSSHGTVAAESCPSKYAAMHMYVHVIYT